MKDYPLRHLSVRVPWHDDGWKGTVCHEPHLNGACAKLKRIADQKRDEDEIIIAGRSLDELPREQWPCCIEERAAFMAPFALEHEKKHPLADGHYRHILPTPQHHPPYSVGVVPFRWMLLERLEELGERLGLNVDASREPDFDYNNRWVHEASNQAALLESFSGHLRTEHSLVFFYAKHVPFVERTDRILIGAGRISDLGNLSEYRKDGDGAGSMIWERPIQHSIRPNEGDGFLMPYHDVLRYLSDHPTKDPEAYTAFAPPEQWEEFSYGGELVTHDGAISALLSLDAALERIERDIGLKKDSQRQWIQTELTRLWKVRGPFPGLGAVLCAFGVPRGMFVAHALQHRAGENQDPWPEVTAAFQDPSILPAELRQGLDDLAPIWQTLPEERRSFLRLLSRFELNLKQAECLYHADSRKKQGWTQTDADILANPYLLYTITRHKPDSIVHLSTVDRGVFPEDTVRNRHPLEEPAKLASSLDTRRIQAFTVAALESAANQGHTLQHIGDLTESIRDLAGQPECPVTSDILKGSTERLKPEVVGLELEGAGFALQLERYHGIGELIRKNVGGRVKGKRHTVESDWAGLLSREPEQGGQRGGFGPPQDREEERAQEEKARALRELAESRFSVLVGPAGTGKTSTLRILCEELPGESTLLLAPTGKARVRMQQLVAGTDHQAQTIAQFLFRNGRYDTDSGRYHLSDRPRKTGYTTVIVDEASMLTEDMLGALLDALEGVQRLILVGDPAQLPPIGAGRPFVDIVSSLRPDDWEARFPRVFSGYAELTIERRQVGPERPDLRLARWFSTTSPSAGEDSVFSDAEQHGEHLRFVEWEQPQDFQERLTKVLVEELGLENSGDQRGFSQALGGTAYKDYDYFNLGQAVQKVEAWQILSPLRSMPFGVGDINRQIHERFRASFTGLATQPYRKVPKPLGAERIVYGDKVINQSNHRRDGKRVYPESGLGYLANGEIGIAIGHFKTRKRNWTPRYLEVEFASQEGFKYSFSAGDFDDEGNAALELAYALTVHRAQGSQFGLVILVLPEEHPILSRELLYTALTRHQGRLVIMHQGPRGKLREFSALHHSETARRYTNLFAPCRMLKSPRPQGEVFLQEGLIHLTADGRAVRSKSELLIAQALMDAGVEFEYEKQLSLGGQNRYPDFTIEDAISGRTIYWEHLGMLSREDYRLAWEKKLAWYRENGILPVDEDADGEQVLVITEDSDKGGLDMGAVKALIEKIGGS